MSVYCTNASHAAAIFEDSTSEDLVGHSRPPIPPQSEVPRRQHLLQRNLMGVGPVESYSRSRTSGCRAELCGFPYRVKCGILLLIGAILAAPLDTAFSCGSSMGTGVFAAPCVSETTTAGAATSEGAEEAQQLKVTNNTELDLTSVFNCSGGDFEVYWSGEVSVTGTIVIGAGTTVRIIGDGNLTGGDSSLSDDEVLEELTSRLSLPRRLTSTAVGVALPNITASTDGTVFYGPMFHVDGGELIMEDFIIRGGFASNITGLDGFGGGIYAVNSKVTIARCEFNNNFAEMSGGGVFANKSIVQVYDSVFRYCQAGVSTLNDDVFNGAGGGIAAVISDLLVDGCLFHGGYANQKGAGISQEFGNMSILDSVFYDNAAGEDNLENVPPIGEGASLSVSECRRSFDGQQVCYVNDTTFVNSITSEKGGAVALDSGDGPWNIEFHRCTIKNSSTGLALKDDPQGEGGAFSVGDGVTLLLSDSSFKHNYSGMKGGVLALFSGVDWVEYPGANVIMRNCSFVKNQADVAHGGVVDMGSFATVTVEGDDNVFEGNKCGEDGGVFAATAYTLVTIEGGTFKGNTCSGNGGVGWSKGNVTIVGANFSENESREEGGVLYASQGGNINIKYGVFESNTAGNGGVIVGSTGSIINIEGGMFEKNQADNGGVALVNAGANLQIQSSILSGNVAERQGGAVSVYDGGSIQITGGNFTNNMAVYGGFLHKEGAGDVSCAAAFILENEGVDGGAIHLVNGATLDWACDMGENSATSGSAIYARDSKAVVQGCSVYANTVARGSVIFAVNSSLNTYQVDFVDHSGSSELSAVQVDQDSTYMAEDTSFIGFAGTFSVSSEGELYLDDCDFSGSPSSVLVYSEPGSIAVIRNAVLGDNNYLALADASSNIGERPSAPSLTNANFKCGDVLEEAGGDKSSSTASQHSPCSGPECLNGDMGVYCQCYVQLSNSEERCAGGDPTTLVLTHDDDTEETIFPALLERDMLLSYVSRAPYEVGGDTHKSSSSGGASESEEGSYSEVDGGVVWSLRAFTSRTLNMNWTIFPSTGKLLPGGSITLTVVTQPSSYFDGTTNVTFAATTLAPPSTPSTSASSSSDNDIGNANSNAAHLAQAGGDWRSPQPGNRASLQEQLPDGVSDTVSFDVTYFHCKAGTFWNLTLSNGTALDDGLDEYIDTCPLCTDGVKGETEGVDCSEAGATINALPIKEGYWRATLELNFIRECSNEKACKGGSGVQSVDEYCGDGYEGVVCSVCSSGYGRGASEQCHLCSSEFKGAMYFVLSVAVVFMLVAIALLSVYLVRGGDAVSATVASTRESARVLLRRSAIILSRSSGGGCTDVGRIGASGTSSKDRSCPTEELSRGTGDESSTLSDTNGDCRGVNNRETLSNFNGVRVNMEVEHDVTAGPTSTPPTQLFTEKKKAFGSEAWSLPALEDTNQDCSTNGFSDEARVVFDPNSEAIIQQKLSRYHAGPRADCGQGSNEPTEIPQSRTSNESGPEVNKASANIAGVLAGLPLSKIKIVIVVWQISSAFAEVTNVTFPPIYETFLSIIGIFSLDLGWILSATCLASDIDFYDKLMIVTIGPMILLSLLGVTFYIGANPTQQRTAEEPKHLTGRSFRRPTEASLPVWTKRRTLSATMPEAVSASPQSKPYSKVGTSESKGRVLSDRGLARTHGPPSTFEHLEVGHERNSVLVDSDEAGAEPARSCSAPLGPTNRSIGVPTRSLRSVWKAGPGNKTDSPQSQLWGLLARHTTMTLIVMYLSYSQVSTVIFQTFACEDYHEISKRYLRADGRIECDTPKHVGYMVYAAVMIFLYPLGIPAVFCYLLVRQKSALNPPTDKSLKESRGTEHVVSEKINQRKVDHTVAPTSFLWDAYYPSRYYYEVFECLRRLVLTGLLVFVPDTSGQVAYGCIFAFISLWAFELQRPHIDGMEIQLYRSGCLVIFFTNFLALIIQAELADEESQSSAVYAVVLIMVHVLFIVSICWNSWATTKATFSTEHIQGVVFGVDIDGEVHADSVASRQRAQGSQVFSENDGVEQDYGVAPEAPSNMGIRSHRQTINDSLG